MIEMDLDELWETQRNNDDSTDERPRSEKRFPRKEKRNDKKTKQDRQRRDDWKNDRRDDRIDNRKDHRKDDRKDKRRDDRSIQRKPTRSRSKSRRPEEDKKGKGLFGKSRKQPERKEKKKVAISKYVEQIELQEKKIPRSRSVPRRNPNPSRKPPSPPQRGRLLSRNGINTKRSSSMDSNNSIENSFADVKVTSGRSQSLDRGTTRNKSKPILSRNGINTKRSLSVDSNSSSENSFNVSSGRPQSRSKSIERVKNLFRNRSKSAERGRGLGRKRSKSVDRANQKIAVVVHTRDKDPYANGLPGLDYTDFDDDFSSDY